MYCIQDNCPPGFIFGKYAAVHGFWEMGNWCVRGGMRTVSEQFTLVPLEAVSGGLYLAVISLDGEVYASRTFIKH